MGSAWIVAGVLLAALAVQAGCTMQPQASTPAVISAAPTDTLVVETPTVIPSTTIPTSGDTATPEATLAPSATATITPPPEDWASVQVESARVWDDPAHEGDYWSLQTELITGERVEVLGEQGEWSQIVAVEQPSSKDPRGYPGWVRSTSLVKGWPTGDQWAVVMVKSTILHAAQAPDSAKMMRLNLDTRLPVINGAGDPVQVSLPDGRTGWLAAGDVRLAAGRDDPYALDTFYQTAQSLVGIPYVWGGTTSTSMDCAGFTYRLFHAYGITLARDANDQALQALPGGGQGTPVEAGAEQRGDLVFTADRQDGPVTHVFMVWGDEQIIDAEPQLGVSIHPQADLMRVAFWSGARRFLP